MEEQCFSSLKNQKKLLFSFYKILSISYKNGNAKDCKFVKLQVVDNESKGNYSHENPINVLTSSLQTSLYDYSDACVLSTGNTAVAGADNNTNVALKNCGPFRECRTEINDAFIDEAEHINIAMLMYNLIECSDIILILQEVYGVLKEMKQKEMLI